MILSKPILNNISAFDKSDDKVFTFNVVGGSQVVKNKLTIRDNITNNVVYSRTINSFSFIHTLPANSGLTNGRQYNAFINTYDINNNESEDSNVIQFYAYTTPTLNISNIPSDNIIDTFTYQFDLSYNQIEGELLNELYFELYSNDNILIDRSPKLFSSNLPPVYLYYTVNNLEDNKSYYAKIKATTINNTYIESQNYNFNVEYNKDETSILFSVENDYKYGGIRIESNIEAPNASKSETSFYEGSKLNVGGYDDFVSWSLTSLPNTDTITVDIWCTYLRIGRLCEIISKSGDKITVDIQRFQYTENSVIKYGDKLLLKIIDENGVLKVNKTSDFIDLQNNNSNMFVRLQSSNGNWAILIDNITYENNEIEWNETSNLEYNYLTNLLYEGETLNDYIPETEISTNFKISDIFKFTLYNGRYDYVNISNKVLAIPSGYAKPNKSTDWDNNTMIMCDFNNNINGGNVQYIFNEIDSIILKRRKVGTLNWTTIGNIKIDEPNKLNINILDTFIPNNTDLEYILQILSSDGRLGNGVISSVTSCFRKLFISDIDENFNIYSAVNMPLTKVRDVQIYSPLGQQYPITVSNSITNYISSNLSGSILGSMDETGIFDKNEVFELSNKFVDFLSNGKTKVIKDWYGRIFLCDILGGFSVTPNMLNGMINFQFNFIEKGNWENENDLEALNLIKKDSRV